MLETTMVKNDGTTVIEGMAVMMLPATGEKQGGGR
jgi:hypothetical protein